MKLYYLPGACSLADHIVLEWSGTPYEAIEVPRDQLRSSWYLAISPGAQVPALVEDDGWTLTENIAILHYLAERHPQAHLAGDDARERAEVNRWLGYLNSEMHPSFKPIFAPARYIADEARHAELGQLARERLHGQFARVDAHLARHDWLAGGRRSIADPYLFVMTRWARGKQVDISGMQHLQRLFDQLQVDPGVQAAMRAEGIGS